MALFLIVLGYLFGSVTTAVVIARLMKLPDPRTQGSGNPGATNMLRSGNKSAALLTLILDILKGMIPVICGRAVNLAESELALIGIAAFLGHIYPIFFRFQGGKALQRRSGYYSVLRHSLP